MKNNLLFVLAFCSAALWAQEGLRTVKVGISSDIRILNPQTAIDSFSLAVMSNVYEPLVAYEATSTRIIPCLAVSWEADASFKTWTYTLRPNVRFHDGTPLTPEAVVKSFAAIPNFPAQVSPRGQDQVVFALSNANSAFNQFLAEPYFCVISAKTLEDPTRAVGTGPFQFEAWEKGKRIILKRNAVYWQKPAALDEVQFIVYPGQPALIKALTAQEIQLADFLTGEAVRDLKGKAYLSVESIMGNSTGFLSMNTRRPPFDDLRVRKAVAAAVNPFELTRRFFSGSAAAPATSMVPPTLFSHFSKIAVNQPDTARALLKEAKWDSTKTYVLLELWAARPYMPDPHGIALEIQKELAAVGIQVRLEQDPEHYFDRLAKGDFDLNLNGWIADSADPVEYIAANLHTRSIGQNNASMWSNPAFDALLDSSGVLKDKDLQARLKQILGLVDKNMPLIPLFYGPQTAVRNVRIQNYAVHPFSQLIMYPVTLSPK
jgi:ABC-type transport system substrate-binding protein